MRCLCIGHATGTCCVSVFSQIAQVLRKETFCALSIPQVHDKDFGLQAPCLSNECFNLRLCLSHLWETQHRQGSDCGGSFCRICRVTICNFLVGDEGNEQRHCAEAAYKAQHAKSRSLVQPGLVLNMLQERHTALRTDTLMGLGRVWGELRVAGRGGGLGSRAHRDSRLDGQRVCLES